MSELASRGPDADTAPAMPPLPEQATERDGRPTPGPRPTATAAGSMLVDRYRLRTRVGGDLAAGAEFWQAEDTVLRRDVAVTVLRWLAPETGAIGGEDDPTGAARAGRTIVRALRSGAFEHAACARLLDVLAPGVDGMPDDVLGAAVTEWVPGRSLAETVADGLSKPLAAARAVAPLAAAAEQAHRHGLVLGCDHPQRVRITPEGRARMCFALPRCDLRPADDVRGLGAVLFALLTSRWPLSGADAARAGLAAAERSTGGAVDAPSALRPGVPMELDTVTVGALGTEDSPGRVRTAAAVHRLLTDAVAEDDRNALFPPEPDGLPSAPDDVWQDRGRVTPPTDPRRRRKLLLGLAVLAAAVLVVLGLVGAQLTSLFGDAVGGPRIVVDAPPAEPPAGSAAAPPPAPSGGPARVADIDVYDDVGDRDNFDVVTRVIDGDQETAWTTSTYQQQLPALKPGIGIMVSLASAVQLSAITIDSPSPDTRIEVRSAPSADAELDETVPLTDVTLADGRTEVSLAESQPMEHLLLWIVELGGDDSDYVTEINEIEFRRAG